MSHFSTENETKILEIENFLDNNQYLSGGPLPDAKDSHIFTSLKEAPDVNKYPNFFYWYQWISQFNPEVVKSWGQSKGTEAPKTEKKEEAAAKKGGDDIDLFGDDTAEDQEAKKKAEQKKTEAPAGAKKKKEVIAKSIVIFDVKVYEEEENLDNLAQKIFNEVNMDGLVWSKDYKLIPIAYGMKKLRLTCVVEDDKVGTDDIFDKILAWEDIVQSVDVDAMQKV